MTFGKNLDLAANFGDNILSILSQGYDVVFYVILCQLCLALTTTMTTTTTFIYSQLISTPRQGVCKRHRRRLRLRRRRRGGFESELLRTVVTQVRPSISGWSGSASLR
jgi:hypothetical protein